MPVDWKKYPKNWKEITLRVKEKAKWKCELCHCPHEQPHPITGSKVMLTTHHINFDIQNNNAYNLIALCQRCHLRLDMPMRMGNRNVNDNPVQLNYEIGSKLYFVCDRKITTEYIEKYRIVITEWESIVVLITKSYQINIENINLIADVIKFHDLMCFDDLELARKVQYRLGDAKCL